MGDAYEGYKANIVVELNNSYGVRQVNICGFGKSCLSVCMSEFLKSTPKIFFQWWWNALNFEISEWKNPWNSKQSITYLMTMNRNMKRFFTNYTGLIVYRRFQTALLDKCVLLGSFPLVVTKLGKKSSRSWPESKQRYFGYKVDTLRLHLGH